MAFRQSFTNVLRDFAAEACSFAEFEQATQRFFTSVNGPNEADWLQAVAAVRAGETAVPGIGREPAESRRFVQVTEERAVAADTAFDVTGSTISSTVAA